MGQSCDHKEQGGQQANFFPPLRNWCSGILISSDPWWQERSWTSLADKVLGVCVCPIVTGKGSLSHISDGGRRTMGQNRPQPLTSLSPLSFSWEGKLWYQDGRMPLVQ